MAEYKKFRIVAVHDGARFCVEVKTILGFWVDGWVNTDYFLLDYETFEKAEEAIIGYRFRIKVIK